MFHDCVCLVPQVLKGLELGRGPDFFLPRKRDEEKVPPFHAPPSSSELRAWNIDSRKVFPLLLMCVCVRSKRRSWIGLLHLSPISSEPHTHTRNFHFHLSLSYSLIFFAYLGMHDRWLPHSPSFSPFSDTNDVCCVCVCVWFGWRWRFVSWRRKTWKNVWASFPSSSGNEVPSVHALDVFLAGFRKISLSPNQCQLFQMCDSFLHYSVISASWPWKKMKVDAALTRIGATTKCIVW